jgi:hypothetical protein
MLLLFSSIHFDHDKIYPSFEPCVIKWIIAPLTLCKENTMGVWKNIPVRLLGTRFEARNCISEPGTQEPYRDFFQ